MHKHAAPVLLAALAICAFAGCKPDQEPRADTDAFVAAPRNPGGSGSAEVKYRPEVSVVEQRDGLDALLSISTDGSTFVFDRHHGAVPALVKGDVLLIKGLLARKVIAAEHTADEIALLTVPAGLLDIVSDAKIRLHAPIRFGSPASATTATPDRSAWQFAADAILAPAHAQSPVEERRKAAEKQGRNDAYGNIVKAPYKALVDGWNTEFSAEPAPGRLNLTLKLKKSNAGVAAIVSGEGYLADFDLDADIDVQRSTVEKMQVAYRKLNGVMNFKWDIQTTNDGSLRGNAFMKLPAAIEIPLYQYLGGLPLFLEVSSAVIIKPGIGSEYSFSHGEFRITYDGYQSFGAKQGVVDSDGKVTGDIKLVDSTSGSGPPVGLVVAFAAPRVELSIGVSKVFKFDGVKDAAAKADKYFAILVTKAFGTEALNKFKASPMSKVTATQIADAAMGSDAAAFIQLVTTSGMSHTGTAVMVPCTRTDLHMSVKVGTSAKAFGQSVGDAEKEIFKKDVTRVRPSENALCNSV